MDTLLIPVASGARAKSAASQSDGADRPGTGSLPAGRHRAQRRPDQTVHHPLLPTGRRRGASVPKEWRGCPTVTHSNPAWYGSGTGGFGRRACEVLATDRRFGTRARARVPRPASPPVAVDAAGEDRRGPPGRHRGGDRRTCRPGAGCRPHRDAWAAPSAVRPPWRPSLARLEKRDLGAARIGDAHRCPGWALGCLLDHGRA